MSDYDRLRKIREAGVLTPEVVTYMGDHPDEFDPQTILDAHAAMRPLGDDDVTPWLEQTARRYALDEGRPLDSAVLGDFRTRFQGLNEQDFQTEGYRARLAQRTKELAPLAPAYREAHKYMTGGWQNEEQAVQRVAEWSPAEKDMFLETVDELAKSQPHRLPKSLGIVTSILRSGTQLTGAMAVRLAGAVGGEDAAATAEQGRQGMARQLELRGQAEQARESGQVKPTTFAGKAVVGALEFTPHLVNSILAGGAGGPIGLGAYWATQEMPKQYDAMVADGVDPAVAEQTAVATGAVMGALFSGGIGKLLPKSVLPRLQDSVAKTALRAAGQGAESFLHAEAYMTAAALTGVVGEELALAAKNGEMSEEDAAKVMERLKAEGEGLVDGIGTMLLISGAMATGGGAKQLMQNRDFRALQARDPARAAALLKTLEQQKAEKYPGWKQAVDAQKLGNRYAPDELKAGLLDGTLVPELMQAPGIAEMVVGDKTPSRAEMVRVLGGDARLSGAERQAVADRVRAELDKGLVVEQQPPPAQPEAPPPPAEPAPAPVAPPPGTVPGPAPAEVALPPPPAPAEGPRLDYEKMDATALAVEMERRGLAGEKKRAQSAVNMRRLLRVDDAGRPPPLVQEPVAPPAAPEGPVAAPEPAPAPEAAPAGEGPVAPAAAPAPAVAAPTPAKPAKVHAGVKRQPGADTAGAREAVMADARKQLSEDQFAEFLQATDGQTAAEMREWVANADPVRKADADISAAIEAKEYDKARTLALAVQEQAKAAKGELRSRLAQVFLDKSKELRDAGHGFTPEDVGRKRAAVKPAEPAPGPAPAPAKEPWQMTAAEYRRSINQPIVDALHREIRAGVSVVVATYTRATKLVKPEHLRLASNGEAQMPEGKRWVTITDQLLDATAQRAGIKTPDNEARYGHKDAVRAAVKAGKRVPAEVLADYPDLQPQPAKPAQAEPETPANGYVIRPAPTAKSDVTGPWTLTDPQGKLVGTYKRKKDARAAIPLAAPPAKRKAAAKAPATPEAFSDDNMAKLAEWEDSANRGVRIPPAPEIVDAGLLVRAGRNWRMTDEARAKVTAWRKATRAKENAEADAYDAHQEAVIQKIERGEPVSQDELDRANVAEELRAKALVYDARPATPEAAATALDAAIQAKDAAAVKAIADAIPAQARAAMDANDAPTATALTRAWDKAVAWMESQARTGIVPKGAAGFLGEAMRPPESLSPRHAALRKSFAKPPPIRAAAKRLANLPRAALDTLDTFSEAAQKAAGVVSTTLRNIAPEFRTHAVDIFHSQNQRNIAADKVVLPFLQRVYGMADLPPGIFHLAERKRFVEAWASRILTPEGRKRAADADILGFALSNGETELANTIADKLGVRKELDAVRQSLADMIPAAAKAGIYVPELADYFPRAVKDYTRLSAHLRAKDPDGWNAIQEAIASVEAKGGTPLTEVEKGFIATNLMRGLTWNGHRVGLGRTSNMKARRIMELTEQEYADFYHPMHEALPQYFYSMNKLISWAEKFGKLEAPEQRIVDAAMRARSDLRRAERDGKDTTAAQQRLDAALLAIEAAGLDLRGSLARIEGRLAATALIKSYRGELSEHDAEVVAGIFKDLYAPRGLSPWMAAARDIAVLNVLADPIQSINQMSSSAYAFYKTGLFDGVKGYADVLRGHAVVKRSDLIHDQVSASLGELNANKALAEGLRVVMFNLTNAADQQGLMNSIVRQGQGLARKAAAGQAKAAEQLRASYAKEFIEGAGTTFEQLRDDLAAGRDTPAVRRWLFGEVSEFHPVSQAEHPQASLRAGNWGIVYTLRKYGIKQFDVLKREVLHEYTEAAAELAAAAATGNKAGMVKALDRGLTASRNASVLVPLMVLFGMSTRALMNLLLDKPNDPEELAEGAAWQTLGVASSYDMSRLFDKDELASGAIAHKLMPPMRAVDSMIKAWRTGKWGEMKRELPLFGNLYYHRRGPGVERSRTRTVALSAQGDVRARAYDLRTAWLESVGEKENADDKRAASKTLNMRTAAQVGDYPAFLKARDEFLAGMGKYDNAYQSFTASLRTLSPLAGASMNDEKREAFLASLSPMDKWTVAEADAYAQATAARMWQYWWDATGGTDEEQLSEIGRKAEATKRPLPDVRGYKKAEHGGRTYTETKAARLQERGAAKEWLEQRKVQPEAVDKGRKTLRLRDLYK